MFVESIENVLRHSRSCKPKADVRTDFNFRHHMAVYEDTVQILDTTSPLLCSSMGYREKGGFTRTARAIFTPTHFGMA